MDLIPNALFRISCIDEGQPTYEPGLYRVILSTRQSEEIVAVLIQPDPGSKPKSSGGRPRKADEDLARQRKKAPKPLVGKLLWLVRETLEQLHEATLLQLVEMERLNLPPLCERSQNEYQRRIKVMSKFLDLKALQNSIVRDRSLGSLVSEAMRAHKASRSFIYRQWSCLCRFGIDEKSLMPRRDLCGAPGVPRPCDPLSDGGYSREKAGRKTLAHRVDQAHGETPPTEQPGMRTDWEKAILAADRQIPTPKPPWRTRCKLILDSKFLARCMEESGEIVYLPPEIGEAPNNRQIKWVIQRNQARIERIMEKTTKRHFSTARRGLNGRDWEGVAGPGHTWAIDSTIGDIYLRSSVNRSWIVGRPVVYVIVDVWSTAVVGFHVCLTGPSWNTAKVSLFNSAADPSLVGDLWGYEPVFALDPAPTLCHSLLCDRGEYLSQGHRSTALKLQLPLSSYTPPYRGDLKGLVEVLHRIRKDEEFLFIPGAIDHRRKEMEFRRYNPGAARLTVREYVQLLYLEFTEYNQTANREHRMDALMLAEEVFPSPAGLWNWGHEVGIGYQRHIPASDLITHLLPSETGVVGPNGVKHARCFYTSDVVQEQQWTSTARNLGSWKTPLNYFPGAMGPIWVPNFRGTGVLRLQLADQSRVSAEATLEEWLDCVAVQTMARSGVEHQRTSTGLRNLKAKHALLERARQLNAAALAKDSTTAPTITQARLIEVAATTHPSRSEEKTADALRDESVLQHEQDLMAILRSADDSEIDDV